MKSHKLLVAGAYFCLAACFAVTAIAQEREDNVIIISVTQVHLPESYPGACEMDGVIRDILDGKSFERGQRITVRVPCGIRSAPMLLPPAVSIHGPEMIAPDVLQRSKLGVAHITGAGKLIWEPTEKSFGTLGAVAGYRVIPGVSLPISGA